MEYGTSTTACGCASTWAGKPIRNLVCHDDCDIVFPSEISQEFPELKQVGAPLRHIRAICEPALRTWTLKLGAVVGGDGVEDQQAYAMPANGDGDLVAEDMVLGFEVGRHNADDGIEGWLGLEGCERGMGAEELREPGRW